MKSVRKMLAKPTNEQHPLHSDYKDSLPQSLTGKLLKILKISFGYRKYYRDRLLKNYQIICGLKISIVHLPQPVCKCQIQMRDLRCSVFQQAAHGLGQERWYEMPGNKQSSLNNINSKALLPKGTVLQAQVIPPEPFWFYN